MRAYWPRFSSSRELALDLRLDVERLLALAHAPLVAGDDQLADLLAQRRVARRPAPRSCSGEQPLELGVDVERRLAAGRCAVGLRLEHLADLLPRAPRRVDRGAGVARAPGGGVLLDRESPPLPIC